MPRLYDFRGNPIKTASLKQEQATAHISGIRSYDDLMPARAYDPSRVARALRAAQHGDILEQSELFAVMEDRDAHLLTEISKRKSALAGLSWQISTDDDSTKGAEIADFVSTILAGLGFKTIVKHALDAVGKGFSCVELMWDYSEGAWSVTHTEHRPQNWFQYHSERPELRLLDHSRDGEELIPGKWLIHKHEAKSGSPYTSALYRVLAWLWLFRNYSLKSWAQLTEIFGMPLRIGRYPLGTSEEDQSRFLAALGNIASDACAIMPEGMSVDIINQIGSGSGNATPHQIFLDWCGKQITLAILGQTLTTDTNGVGSQALGNVHNEVRHDLLADDAEALAESINMQIIRPLVWLNFGPQNISPYLQFELPDTGNKQEQANLLKSLCDLGMAPQIPLWYVREKFRLPVPAEGEATLADLAKPTSKAAPEHNSLQTNAAEPARADADPDDPHAVLDALQEALAPTMEQVADDLIAPILAMFETCSSYEEAQGKLLTLWPELNTDRLMESLSKADFSSRVWGAINAEKSKSLRRPGKRKNPF